MKNLTLVLAAAFTGATAVSTLAAPVQVDAALPSYQKAEGVSGSLNSIGSDTLNNLMTLWAESFRKHYPNVNAQIEGKGSATAPPALIEGTAQLGPMSRPMKDEESAAFEAKYGFKPVAVPVALDALAVFVHKDNPVKSLSIPQIDAIFSKTRKQGAAADISTWGDAGLTGDWEDMPVSLYGRNSSSGTYGYFKEHTLKKGDFKDTVKEQPGSASVVNGVTNDREAIGYSGIGYVTSGVKPLWIAATEGGKAMEPNYENVLSGDYPIARSLYVYVAKKPGEPLPPAVKEFLLFVLSKEGQEIVVKDGYLPLTAEMAAEVLKELKN